MAAARTKKLASVLARLEQDDELGSEHGREVLADALTSRDARLVVQAARLVTEHGLAGLEERMASAYRELAGPHASVDPGGLAKEALLAVLEACEYDDAELFAEAATYEHRERLKGVPRETGARVRVRGVLGLARLGHPDLTPILGACLCDHDASVRLAAARAVGHRGQRDGAGLLLLRLGAGETEREVAIECVRGLFATAPDLATHKAQAMLHDGDPAARELALHALGTASADAAIELLASELERAVIAEQRAAVIEALGLSTRPPARSLLLEIVRSGREDDAESALVALAIHRYDPRLAAQVHEASAHSRPLARRAVELFGPAD